MSAEFKNLLLGALKSAVGAAAGLISGLPVVDPSHFSLASLGGWEHLGMAILWVVIVSEARFWGQWASAVKGNDHGGPGPQV